VLEHIEPVLSQEQLRLDELEHVGKEIYTTMGVRTCFEFLEFHTKKYSLFLNYLPSVICITDCRCCKQHVISPSFGSPRMAGLVNHVGPQVDSDSEESHPTS